MSFAPSADALGTFGIYALNSGGDSTVWIDAASDPSNSRDFANLPKGSPQVRIADVLVTSVADYNHNGIVDAADYTVWRDGLGTTYTQADYDVWKSNFGNHSGSGSNSSANAAVPEPATALILLIGILTICCRRHADRVRISSTRETVINRPV